MELGSCPAGIPNPCPGHATGLSAVLFTNLISTLLQAQCDLGNPEQYPRDVNAFHDEYDFVIVGAGSAGSVVANRLTEVEGWKVLLLEAGGDPPITSRMPALFFALEQTSADWHYRTEPEAGAALGLKDQRSNWPRGKALGGSSTINAMVYVRGNRRDYDHWASLGNPGWGYSDVLPYFKKSEDIGIPSLKDSPYHSTGGYLSVERFEKHPIDQVMLDALKEVGYEYMDTNGARQAGSFLLQATSRNKTRADTATAFLGPIKDRKNLHVSKFSHATRLIINEETMSVEGVEFIKNGIKHQVKVTKEVIVSAGSVNSPQLLMLSGIGPREHLEELGIRVIKDLKVGHNLQDHIMYFGPTFNVDSSKVGAVRRDVLSVDAAYQYLLHRKGPLAGWVGISAQAFMNTKFADPSGEYPDIQMQHLFFFKKDEPGIDSLKTAMGYGTEAHDAMFKNPNSKSDVLVTIPSLLRPKSKGFIKLKNTDPMEYPLIHPNYLSDEQDVLSLIEGIKLAIANGKTSALQEIDARISTEKIASCEAHDFGTDDYWECAVRQAAVTIYHPVGTCKMGPDSDPDAVVDPELKVRGVRGLRVIDASIMPRIVSGNTNAAAIMIGEKGADLAKKDWLREEN